MIKKSNVVDIYSETANMYGCEPCPKCGSKYRYITFGNVIQCDDCGYDENSEIKSEIKDDSRNPS